jgi:putative membrane protein
MIDRFRSAVHRKFSHNMAAFIAFLHHIAAFTLVAALVVEFMLIREPLTPVTARRIRAADMVYGAAAGVVLIAGLLRVFYFEKGAGYYFSSVPFLAKLSLFIAVALLSIYPTVEFVSWRKPLRQGQVPPLTDQKRRRIRSLLHWQLAAILALILCAALMAKGIGYRG